MFRCKEVLDFEIKHFGLKVDESTFSQHSSNMVVLEDVTVNELILYHDIGSKWLFPKYLF